MPLSGGSSDPEGRPLFAEQLRRAVEASPRVELAKMASLLWRAYAAGQVSEDHIRPHREQTGSSSPTEAHTAALGLAASLSHLPRWSAAGAGPPQEPCRRPWPPGSPWP